MDVTSVVGVSLDVGAASDVGSTSAVVAGVVVSVTKGVVASRVVETSWRLFN